MQQAAHIVPGIRSHQDFVLVQMDAGNTNIRITIVDERHPPLHTAQHHQICGIYMYMLKECTICKVYLSHHCKLSNSGGNLSSRGLRVEGDQVKILHRRATRDDCPKNQRVGGVTSTMTGPWRMHVFVVYADECKSQDSKPIFGVTRRVRNC